MLDQRLIAGAVVEEERGHRASRDGDSVASGGEWTMHEGGRGAARVRHGNPVAVRIVRRLYRTRGKRNDEVALHAAGHPSVHGAWRTSVGGVARTGARVHRRDHRRDEASVLEQLDRKSTRLNSSHLGISYAVFCLKKKKKKRKKSPLKNVRTTLYVTERY